MIEQGNAQKKGENIWGF